MERVNVKNVADPEQVKEAKRKERFDWREDYEDLHILIQTKSGRRFIADQLISSGMFKTSFSRESDKKDSEVFFNEGERNVGLRLWAKLLGVLMDGRVIDKNPQVIIEWIKEIRKDKRNV